MLKAVQGTIAAVKAEDNDNNGSLPSNKVIGPNFFDDDFDKEKIENYIVDNLNESLIDEFHKHIKEITDKRTLVEWLTNSLLNIKANNYPFESAPSREKMPQAFKGGTDENDKKSSLPDKEGSAMNKLRDDKFMKSAVK